MNAKPYTYNLTDEQVKKIYETFHLTPLGVKIEVVIPEEDPSGYKIVPCTFEDGSCKLF